MIGDSHDPMLESTRGIVWPLLIDSGCYEMLLDIVEHRMNWEMDVAEDAADLKRRFRTMRRSHPDGGLAGDFEYRHLKAFANILVHYRRDATGPGDLLGTLIVRWVDSLVRGVKRDVIGLIGALESKRAPTIHLEM